MAENKKRGSLIVISGFSGVGKGTVVKRLVSDFGYNISVSATTRSPREGEVDGREYYFMGKSEFENLIDYGGFIEWTREEISSYGILFFSMTSVLIYSGNFNSSGDMRINFMPSYRDMAFISE